MYLRSTLRINRHSLPRLLKYVKGGQLIIDPLVSMGGNLYESLIDIHPPSKIIEFRQPIWETIPQSDMDKVQCDFK